MTKENKKGKSESNIFNFRVTSKSIAKEFRRRVKSLTDKASFQEVFEDGIQVHEGKDLEGTLLKKKAMKIAKRETVLTEFISLNGEIEAHNKRLRAISSRQRENLDVFDNVLYLKIYDKDNNLLYEFNYKPESEK